MKSDSSLAKRVPARAVSVYTFSRLPQHETIWAIAAGYDGMVHIAVCCESVGGGTVQLYSYDLARRTMRHTLDVAKSINEPPENGHAAHGKIHFSLCPSKDQFLYAATHCSTPPAGDWFWDAHTMWNDRRKSFTGAHFFRFHPGTGKFDDFGVLFPNEGCGVMALDDASGRCVGVTYPFGRMFFISNDGKEKIDVGRVADTYTLALVNDGHGRVYGTDTYGFFLRVDMKQARVDHLQTRIPIRRDASGRYVAMADAVLGPDERIYFSCYRMPDIFRFEPRASGGLEIEHVAEAPGSAGITGLAFADDGMLYCCARKANLCRVNVGAKKLENLGALHVNGADRLYWRCVKGSDGKLYAGECGRKPVSMIIIDPSKL